MTYKNEKIRNATLIALFTLALLVSGTAMQSANASVNPIVNVDRLVTDMSSTQTEISKLTANPVNNAVKIEALNERFWTTNDLINTMTNVEPKRDFVSEWKTLEQKQDSVKNTLTVLKKFGIAQSFDQTLNTQITQTEIDIEQLRQDSIRSMILDPKIQKELEAIQNRIHQEYPHIIDSAIDSEQQKVSVLVDYDVVSNTNATLAMLQTFGIDKVMVEGLPEITGCTMTKTKCDPALGGLAIVRQDETSTRGFSGSIGYKASNSNGDTGFVTAGHVADWSTRDTSGSSNSVMNFFDGTKIGDVTEAYGIKSPARTDGKKHVDVAFVKTNKITDYIFLYKNVQLDIVSYADAKSDHVKGDLIYRIGAASGLQDYGYIKKVYKNTDIIKHGGMTVKIGDSGGTIYQKNSQGKAIVLGHVTSTLFYIPAYKVIDLYGITPLTR